MRKIKNLYRIKVLTPVGFWHLTQGIFREEKTINALLYYCSKMYPNNIALVQGKKQINYQQFYKKSLHLASNIAHLYKLKQGNRVALMAKNSLEATITLFALSRIGVNIYLLNPEMSESQLTKLCSQNKFDFIIYDDEQTDIIIKLFEPSKTLPLLGMKVQSVQKLIEQTADIIIEKRKAGNIIVLTSGTTGSFKSASRKQSVSNFLNPLVALIDQMQLHKFKTVYIPTPIYHGYGLASLIVSILLGSQIYLTNGFNAKEGCDLIKNNKIEVVTLVPIMLARMLSKHPASIKSLKRILSGGAPLTPGLIANTTKHLGQILYNLYGTTEAGFCVLGTPKDLSLYPETIGRAIKGVRIRINSDKDIGVLEVKSNWVMKSKQNKWVKTGDLATINKSKLIFLKGRNDSMVISGGENVYPKDLEDVLSVHDKIETASVIGVPHYEFGSRLKAFVVLKPQQKISETELKNWLKTKIARYQMPISIEFLENLPLTSIGKINKKVLK